MPSIANIDLYSLYYFCRYNC